MSLKRKAALVHWLKKLTLDVKASTKTFSCAGNPKWHILVSLCVAMGLNLRLSSIKQFKLDNFTMKYEDLPKHFPEICPEVSPKTQGPILKTYNCSIFMSFIRVTSIILLQKMSQLKG